MISRLGVLGGMFDPVHTGHVAAAKHAVELLQLDALKMIPCNQPNHRDAATASTAHRLSMLQLAIEGSEKIEIDDCEILRGGVSYSADTLKLFRSTGISEHIVFVLGMDSLNSIVRWHHWESLFDMAHFLVLARNSEEVNSETAEAIGLSSRLKAVPQELFEGEAGFVHISESFEYSASSTKVRAALQSNSAIDQLLDQKVSDYIMQNRLYV